MPPPVSSISGNPPTSSNSPQSMKIPARLLIQFFQNCTTDLNRKHEKQLVDANFEDSDPVTLSEHRSSIIEVQRNALNELLRLQNKPGPAKGPPPSDERRQQGTAAASQNVISAEQFQTALRSVGAGDNDGIDVTDERETQELLCSMAAMNDAARAAFVRSVLYSEWRAERGKMWLLRNDDDDDGSGGGADRERNVRYFERRKGRTICSSSDGGKGGMERGAVLEFCGLCIGALRLEEVQRFLSCGESIFGYGNGSAVIDEFPVINFVRQRILDQGVIKSMTPQGRMSILEGLLCRAIGYDLEFAMLEMQRLTTANESQDDEELIEMFNQFLSAISTSLTTANLANGGVTPGELSDCNEGGVTRVVSVKYSETVIGDETAADVPPSQAAMEQQKEAFERQQFETARKAAALQQSILGELLTMDEISREKQLVKAKEAHDSFLESALAIPAGLERVKFMKDIDADTQRLLIMHKLWEKMLADNGGVPPKMRSAE
mmetsp:Transcript_52210/g.62870  ORF Transcript_52210/g.62870 Transcript_52210/m.62870 type:complete len:493 (+) Transcript_52210:45-1523(+)